jgi:hypothetical protein
MNLSCEWKVYWNDIVHVVVQASGGNRCQNKDINQYHAFILHLLTQGIPTDVELKRHI